MNLTREDAVRAYRRAAKCGRLRWRDHLWFRWHLLIDHWYAAVLWLLRRFTGDSAR